MTSHTIIWYRLWLLWATVTLLTGTLPLSNFVGHPDWNNLHWFITTDDVRYRRFFLDLALNIGLYIPWGFLYARHALITGLRNPSQGILFALLFSGTIEFYQIFCVNRFPSLLDIANNTGGAIIGVVAAKRFAHVSFSRFIRAR